ncbi:hypothetical protein CONPUDRAFT_85748 [Coniophora puteana RWD-64-598 SS2]|uniref:Uncharacterized protein n=1 Tax=Coniophora puteana (strain RWD-64-598) TaxID=741705 RepID=R7SFR5_CONPW|nr:uncharacterized protein CONPUDRAFT_85748 [Coniophora puteana RWD-64-598 SS2]EIW74582.1 hypothetical protein CONPUDRAFT_85748 [Coniophora puteana RWD-64-598 SS2]
MYDVEPEEWHFSTATLDAVGTEMSQNLRQASALISLIPRLIALAIRLVTKMLEGWADTKRYIGEER